MFHNTHTYNCNDGSLCSQNKITNFQKKCKVCYTSHIPHIHTNHAIQNSETGNTFNAYNELKRRKLEKIQKQGPEIIERPATETSQTIE